MSRIACLIMAAFALCVFGNADEASSSSNSALARLRALGEVQVLTGPVRVAHYAKRSWKMGTCYMTCCGTASFKIAVDFSHVVLGNDGSFVLPCPYVSWFQMEEKETSSKIWDTGIAVTDSDKREFLNGQYAHIEQKVSDVVHDEEELLGLSAQQALLIARSYLSIWGFADCTVVLQDVQKGEKK